LPENWTHQKPFDALLRNIHKGCIDLAIAPGAKDFDLSANGRSRRLQLRDCRSGNNGVVRIDQHGKACGSWQQLMQESKLFRRKFRLHVIHAGDVAAWPV
jgi:hypothetical protein